MSTTLIMNPARLVGLNQRRRSLAGRSETVFRRNRRAYNKALRAAEMAAWDASGGNSLPGRSTPRESSATRLPRPETRSEGETALYAMILFAVVATLVFSGGISLQFATHWQKFVQLVQHFIG